jgi:hypothetical protein
MTVAEFSDLSGRVFSGEFAEDAQVHTACDFLAGKLGLRASQIRLLRLVDDDGPRFYPSASPLFPSTHPFFVFQVVIVAPRVPDYSPPAALLDTIEKSGKYARDYSHYSNVIHSVPPDFEARLQQILEMGFERSKAEEALRNAGGDTERALEVLTTGDRWPFFGGPSFGRYGGPFMDPSLRFGLDYDYGEDMDYRMPPRFRGRGRGGGPRRPDRGVPPSPPRPEPSPSPPSPPQPMAEPPPPPEPGNARMTPEVRQVYNRVRRRNQITEEGFLLLLDDLDGNLSALQALLNA